ncbi:MATE family efflux transporter DinF [Oceanisphaera psychrotolerans]|uniref:MATE family efflux transporter n=1 Tax=Oceanisphaera psychrotolerans TaxID=1414654 RepID=A0A1J4QDX6_9GAMM|nr:MATE family efflux transporter DinF [Oceanisphaera psychrotolerans]OIN09571.1 MATE family efflux transporter [Oceanisphaera psychrotolerans]
MWSSFLDRARHRQVFALALPMVLSNITVPLLGLVDTIVIGHLEHAYYLGGVAVGATIISLTFWLLGFLRMSTTGLAAQAVGAGDGERLLQVLARGLLLAWGLALMILLAQQPLMDLAFWLVGGSSEVQHHGRDYVMIRIWSAPAALTNLVLLGWLLGNQNARAPMLLLILGNGANILLDIWFVLGLGWQVKGAAAASVLADYLAMALGAWLVWKTLQARDSRPVPGFWQRTLHLAAFKQLLGLNRDIFIRALCLQLTFAFMTFQGARLGDEVLAANAVLMNFLMFISFGLDGFAYAVEAMVGKAVGERNRAGFRLACGLNLFWGGVVAVLFTLVFALAGEPLIGLITDIAAVRSQASQYLPWLVLMPLAACWCFILDGIFIGTTRGREMRDMMLLSTAGVFFPVWWLAQGWGNHGLWLAMLCFMLARGLTLGWAWWRLEARQGFVGHDDVTRETNDV